MSRGTRPGFYGGAEPIEGYHAPTIVDGKVIVPFARDTTYAVGVPAGTPKWRIFLGRPGYAGEVDLAPLPRPSGGCEWSPAHATLYSPPVIAGDGTVITGSGEGWVYAIEG